MRRICPRGEELVAGLLHREAGPKIGPFKRGAALSSRIRSITANAAYDHQRSGRSRPEISIEPPLAVFDDRAVLVRRDIEGQTSKEVAGALGLTRAAVKSHLRRAGLGMRSNVAA